MIPLDGAQAATTNVFESRDLPPGAYHVTATVLNAGGHRTEVAHAQVNVIESGRSR